MTEKKTIIQRTGLAGLYSLTDPEFANKMRGIGLRKGHLTGKLMTMVYEDDKRIEKVTGEGRVICSLFGVVAVPKGVLKELYQYPVAGIIRDKHIDIIFSTGEGIHRPDMIGMGVSGCLTSPIWSV